MSPSLADRLNRARHERFVGREGEIAAFQSALTAQDFPFYVLHIFGPGGVGKTSLLREFSYLCQQKDVYVPGLNGLLAPYYKQIVILVGIIGLFFGVYGFAVAGVPPMNTFGVAQLNNPFNNVLHIVVGIWALVAAFGKGSMVMKPA